VPRIRAVIFDLGHTLWDFAPTEASRRLSVLRLQARLDQALGHAAPSPAEVERAIELTARRWFETWNDRSNLEQPPSEELVRDALSALELNPTDDLVYELTTILFGVERDMPVIVPDSLAAIASLDGCGLVMGCVTNTVLLEQGIHDVLTRLGLLHYLRSVVVSSAAGYRKPHPSLFRCALEQLDVPPKEAVFVGDRLEDDIAGAQAVGMRGVLTHQYRQEPLDGASVRPDAVIQRLSELPGVIARLEAGS